MKTKTCTKCGEEKPLRKTFQYRAYPNKGTAKRAFLMMKTMAVKVWNPANNERIKTFEMSKKDKNIKPVNSYKDQYHQIKKSEHPEFKKYNAQTMQDVLVKLDGSYRSFWALYKKDKTHRPPKNKGIHKCLVFRNNSKSGKLVGCHLEGKKLIVPTLGVFKINMHRPVEGRIKTVSITLDKNLWYVNISCDMGRMPPKKRSGKTIKIILPDDCFLQDSEGNVVDSLDYYKRAEPKIQQLSMIVARRRKGCPRRKKAVRTLAKCHRHIKNQRDYFLWEVVNYYAGKYKRILLYTRPFKLAMQYAERKEEAKLTADNARSKFVDMLGHKCNELGAILTIIKEEKSWQKEVEKRTEVAKLRKLKQILRQAKRAVKYKYRGRLPCLERECERLTMLRI